MLFQSYLYGIEIKILLDDSTFVVSFNRTFMELKCERLLLISASAVSFNRTFMELKFVQLNARKRTGKGFQSYLYGIEMRGQHRPAIRQQVSIVPLWN